MFSVMIMPGARKYAIDDIASPEQHPRGAEQRRNDAREPDVGRISHDSRRQQGRHEDGSLLDAVCQRPLCTPLEPAFRIVQRIESRRRQPCKRYREHHDQQHQRRPDQKPHRQHQPLPRTIAPLEEAAGQKASSRPQASNVPMTTPPKENR